MYKKKKILAIIPARSGSKGIKNKNLKKINGISLVEHAARCLKKIKIIDHIHVSTDGKKIFQQAEKLNLPPLFYRLKKFSGSKVSDFKVVQFVLKKIEKILKTKFDIILLIQPTSPNRKKKDVIDCIKLLDKKKASSVWTLSKTDFKFHPLKQFEIHNNKLKFCDQRGSKIVARQQLNQVYHRNGICYAMSRKTVVEDKSIKGKKCYPYLIDRNISNIDTLKDLEYASQLMKR